MAGSTSFGALLLGIFCFGHMVGAEKNKVQLLTIPGTIEQGLYATPTFTVICNVTGGFKYLSIAQFKHAYDYHSKIELASIDTSLTVTRGAALHQNAEVWFTASAGLPTSIGITTPSPGPAQAGTYFCSGFREDHTQDYQIRTVQLAELDVRAIVSLIRQVETSLSKTRESVSDLKEEAFITKCEARTALDLAKTIEKSIFTQSAGFQNRTYLLTQYSPITFLKAQDICRARGGHLAEIDSREELDFIRSFLKGIVSTKQYVLFGARRSPTDPYAYLYGERRATVLDFYPGRPNGLHKDSACVALVKDLYYIPGLKMDVVSCDYVHSRSFDWAQGFLCEVPGGFFPGDSCDHDPPPRLA